MRNDTKQLGRFMGMASYYNNGRVAEPSKKVKDAVTFLGYDSFSDFLLRNFNEEAHDVPRRPKTRVGRLRNRVRISGYI